MKTILVHINECYGGFCYHMKREYSSIEEFNADLSMLQNLTKQEVMEKYYNRHPLDCSHPQLYKIELAEDEDYFVTEYDGYESISICKKAELTSNVERALPKTKPFDIPYYEFEED